MPNRLIPLTISPLVRRHGEDAAFYWTQHDRAADSPRLLLHGLERFSCLLSAHLEGLAVAGDSALAVSMSALERWNKPAEAFVCAYVTHAGAHQHEMEACWSRVESHPDQLLRGAISALAWLPASVSWKAMRALGAIDAHPVRQVAVLRALALRDTGPQLVLDQPLEHFLHSADHHVRAAAWRLAAASPIGTSSDQVLASGLRDAALAPRAEAAIALAVMGAVKPDDRKLVVPAQVALSECVTEQATVADAAGGWQRMQAMRRLTRWLQWLAVLLPVGHPAVPELLTKLPARAGLSFVAAHGDAQLLPYVVQHMDDPQLARFAGWVWQTVSGVDLVAAGLSLPEPETDALSVAVTDAQQDADNGLPRPDGEAVRRYPLADLRAGHRYLLGREVTPVHTLAVFESCPQAQRAIALRYLQRQFPHLGLGVRAPVSGQRHMLAHLSTLMTNEVVA